MTRVLLVCGGGVTEPRYFEGLKRAFRNPAVQIDIRKKGVDPTSLVEYAAVIHDRDPDTFDEIWCVVDVDEFDLSSAVRLANGRGVRLAISNPCFEIWLLLHHADCRGHVDGPADALRRLKRHVPDYSKGELRFERFGGGVADAITRARKLADVGEEQVRNPSSGVWIVVATVVGNEFGA